MIWPSDLVFIFQWPSFKLDLDFIETNNLTKFYEDEVENVASGVLTWFFYDLT